MISFAPCGAGARWGAGFPAARAVGYDLSPATRAGVTLPIFRPLHQTIAHGIQLFEQAGPSPPREQLRYLLSLIAREAGERS